MMLKDFLYRLVSAEPGNATVELLPDCPVYAAHFPGFPITPGVTLVQMAVELMGCTLVSAKDIKFVAPVFPSVEGGPRLRFQWLVQDDGKADVAIFLEGETLCAKMQLFVKTNTDTLVLIPTYNNAGTLDNVLRRTLAQKLPVMVVDDGSTDGTAQVLHTLRKTYPDLLVVTHQVNCGKGRALKTGFQEARRRGFDYVLTLDADGQHAPEDIPVLLSAKGEKNLVVGSRNIQADGMAGSSTFANRFSNFWFTLYTWVKLPDTQTGYRLYPLRQLPWLGLLSARYEAELTLLVFSAWKGLRLVPVPVKVFYPKDRVTHFHPVKDFTRISVLNTLLLFVALFYGYPRMIFHSFRKNL